MPDTSVWVLVFQIMVLPGRAVAPAGLYSQILSSVHDCDKLNAVPVVSRVLSWSLALIGVGMFGNSRSDVPDGASE